MLKTRSKYKRIKWNKKQKRDFNNFWKSNYGKKINSKYHKLIESVTGHFNPKYIPDNLFHSNFEYKLNDYNIRNVLGDKNVMHNLYSKISGVILPKTIISNTSGQFRNWKNELINEDEAINLLKLHDKFIIKPTIGSSGGRNVQLLRLSDIDLQEVLEKYKENYLVQEYIKQHESTAVFHPTSGNTIRFMTYIINNKIFASKMTMRMGRYSSHLDNAHSGGIVIGINDDGQLQSRAIGWDENYNIEYYEQHPDTNVIFKDKKIECVNKLVEAGIKLHENTPHLRTVSWDFIIDEHQNPVLIEGNFRGQSVRIIQFTHKEPIFGENTEKFLHYMKKINKKKHYTKD